MGRYQTMVMQNPKYFSTFVHSLWISITMFLRALNHFTSSHNCEYCFITAAEKDDGQISDNGAAGSLWISISMNIDEHKSKSTFQDTIRVLFRNQVTLVHETVVCSRAILCGYVFSHIRTSLILELLVSIRVNTYWIVLVFDTSSRQHYVPNIVCTRTDMHKTVTTVTRFKPAVYWPTSSHKRQ